uniref:PPM-type phosphatase domain-containing protein n=1 Tax=Onchocerca volvulus TaxID=6282 RepID=A0A8R1TU81_ONCVO
MDDTTGCKSHWYDKLYDVCCYTHRCSVPEAFYERGRLAADGCALQHKTFSYVRPLKDVVKCGIYYDKPYSANKSLRLLPYTDQRSGRTVRLYGIVDRFSPGADADFLISQIVSDILPFDRTDHVLNNNPSDREIFILLEEVLRKVYKVELNTSNASTRSYHGSESRGSPGSFESRNESSDTREMSNIPPGISAKPANGVDLPNLASLNSTMNETVAQKLSVMQFINFYKDIIERVNKAANEDKRKSMELAEINQVHPFSPTVNPYSGYVRPTAQFQYPVENPHIEATTYDSCSFKVPVSPSRKRNNIPNRKFAACNTSLPTISESVENRWNEENESLMKVDHQQNFEFVAKVSAKSQQDCSVPPIEVTRSNDDEFFNAVEKVATDLGYVQNDGFKENEIISTRDDDKDSTTDFSSYIDSVPSYTAVAIVFIYGEKLFVASIGDSRVILMRQKCHYMDVMYLNEPPLAWCPIAAPKDPYSKSRNYILFQEPIIRGGFLINEYAFFLLMFNCGVTENMLKVIGRYRTSNEINRNAVQMVIKILQTDPAANIAETFVGHLKHCCNRKYRLFPDVNGLKREAMSFLFADFRQLIPTPPDFDHLLMNYNPEKDDNTLEPKAHPYPKMTQFSDSLENNEELMKDTWSMNKTYDMLQEIFDREEHERRTQAKSVLTGIPAMNEETWFSETT